MTTVAAMAQTPSRGLNILNSLKREQLLPRLRLVMLVLSNFSAQETFDMKINGNDYTITFNARDYTTGGLTEDDFAADMQTAINAAVAGADYCNCYNKQPLNRQTTATGLEVQYPLQTLSALMQTALGVTDATASTANYTAGANSGVTVYLRPYKPNFSLPDCFALRRRWHIIKQPDSCLRKQF